MIIGFLGIILSLLLLITMAYRGTSVVIAAPVCAAVAMVFSGAPFLATYTDIFMPALGKFITSGIDDLGHPLISHTRGAGLLLAVVLTEPVAAAAGTVPAAPA